jgi:hypothetical protein
MKRRGVGSIVAVIFLVMMMGVAMLAFISIYGNYRELYSLQSEMNRWESLRLREKLVEVENGSGNGGGGGGTNTLNRTFLVANETIYKGSIETDTPRLWRYDSADGNSVYISSASCGHGTRAVNITYTFLTTELNVYSGEDWDFTLKMRFRTIPQGVDFSIYAYDQLTDQYDLIDTFTTSNASYNEWEKSLSWGDYVNNERATIMIHAERSGSFSFYIDRLVLEATYSYSQAVTYSRFNVSSTDPSLPPDEIDDLWARDGDVVSDSGDLELTCTISGLSSITNLRDISGFVTIAASSFGSYDVEEVKAYNYSSNSWVNMNSTVLSYNEEVRIRVPLSSDFISDTGVVKLQIEAERQAGNYVYLDEVVVEVTWLGGGDGDGGGTSGSLVIRNDSPFASRIVRIWYINETYTYIYDPSSYIVLQPGETLDLSTYHSLTDIDLVKVVTDYGNVFSFIP